MDIRQQIGILERPEFVVVHRDHNSFSGVLFEWRRRRQLGGWMKRSARVIYMDEEAKVLRQAWFLEPFVDSIAQPPSPSSLTD